MIVLPAHRCVVDHYSDHYSFNASSYLTVALMDQVSEILSRLPHDQVVRLAERLMATSVQNGAQPQQPSHVAGPSLHFPGLSSQSIPPMSSVSSQLAAPVPAPTQSSAITAPYESLRNTANPLATSTIPPVLAATSGLPGFTSLTQQYPGLTSRQLVNQHRMASAAATLPRTTRAARSVRPRGQASQAPSLASTSLTPLDICTTPDEVRIRVKILPPKVSYVSCHHLP